MVAKACPALSASPELPSFPSALTYKVGTIPERLVPILIASAWLAATVLLTCFVPAEKLTKPAVG